MSTPPERKPTEPMRVRLYILSHTAPSDAALLNLTTIAEAYLEGRYELEVVDVREEPLRALNDGALIVPTLIVMTDRGNRVLVGDLSDTQAVLQALGLSSAYKVKRWTSSRDIYERRNGERK